MVRAASGLSSRLGAALFGAALACTGCTADPLGCSPDGGEPQVTVGKGLDSYHELQEGGRELELVHGPQGGFHVDLAVRALHLDSTEQLEGELVGILAGEVRAESFPYVDLRCNGSEGTLDSWALRLIWDASPADLDGQLVTVQVELTDVGGRTVSASEADVLIEDPLL